MLHYRYTATGPDGKRVEGTVRAATWQDVDRQLQSRGFKMTGIVEIAPNQVASQPSVSAPPMVAKPPTQPAPATTPSVSAKLHKTRYAKDKDLFFLFSQIASYLKAGVNPAQALSNLASSQATTKFREALTEGADAATSGLSVASVLERYPYLFPPHVVGMYRAGEMGGFLPEACESIATQAENSHKFKRWYAWLGWCVISILATIPLMNWGDKGIWAAWDKMEASGGNVDGFATVRDAFLEEFWRTLPFTIIFTVISVVAYLIWQSMKNRGIRHKLVLLVPTTSKRARLESISTFSWAMSNLFRAGLSPKTVVEVAAQTMPNLELSRQMSSAAQSMRAETKLSEVASRVSMLTPEMQTIVSTGEFVGDLPGALQNVATAHQGEFQSTSKMSTARIGCWMLLLLTLGTYLMFMIFVRKFYDTAFQKLGDEPLPMLVRPLSQDQTLP